MPITVVVGGQFGSEGKGKVSAHVARASGAAVVVRVGGPNSGHSAVDVSGSLVTLRQLPAGAVGSDAQIVLPAGSLINVSILLREIAQLGISPSRLRIDAKASIVSESHILSEANLELSSRIGSTGSGTGAALIDRLSRSASHLRARNVAALSEFIEDDTVSLLREVLDKGQRIVIEGTQGFGLSVWQSVDYPFATSRDTSAAAFVSETGLAPHDVDDVILVLRTFPIRVGGNSGPLCAELTWAEVAEEAELPAGFQEFTTATRRVRRVGRFDPSLVKRAIATNRPHRIVLNHMDYIDPAGRDTSPSIRSRQFVEWVEGEIGQQVDLLGYSASSLVAGDLRNVKLRA